MSVQLYVIGGLPVQVEQNRVKRYVMVCSRTDELGRVLPQRIIWGDGVSYEIDRILDVERRASRKAGGTGMRYHVLIGSRETYLYYENPRWFVEAKQSDLDCGAGR